MNVQLAGTGRNRVNLGPADSCRTVASTPLRDARRLKVMGFPRTLGPAHSGASRDSVEIVDSRER